MMAAAVVRYRRRAISRLNLIISWTIGAGVLFLAVAPFVFDPLFDLFNFRRGNFGRLIAAQIFGLIVLFGLLVRNMSYTDQNERAIRQLVEALAVQSFEGEQQRLGERLPTGPCIVAVSPAYNEAENVAAVIRDIPEQIEGY